MGNEALGHGDVRQRVERAFNKLGFGPVVWRNTLDESIAQAGAERDRWIKLDREQPFVHTDIWRRFPWQKGWKGLYVVGSGSKVDEPLPAS